MSKEQKVNENTNFLLTPWGSRRLIISEYVSEGVHRTGEGLFILTTYCNTRRYNQR